MKTVLITGAAGDIGKAIALSFAASGFTICLHYNNSEGKARLIKDILTTNGTDCEIFKADLSKADEIEEMFAKVRSFCGGVDVIVNNAGISHIEMLCDISCEKIDELLAVNTRAPILCCKYGTEKMIHNKWGRIINISSMWGVSGASCETVYSASKSAVIGFTKALAKELAPSGITVNCVAPGFIDTQMNKGLSPEDRQALIDETPVNRIGTPEDVANAVMFFASEASGFITGQTLCCDGGFIL